MKNTALWESADGLFDSYVSCELPPAKVKTLPASAMQVVRQGSITKVVCSYPGGINFTHRTKAACKIEDDKACATGAAGCLATCE
jgi:hypothetical protein